MVNCTTHERKRTRIVDREVLVDPSEASSEVWIKDQITADMVRFCQSSIDRIVCGIPCCTRPFPIDLGVCVDAKSPKWDENSVQIGRIRMPVIGDIHPCPIKIEIPSIVIQEESDTKPHSW